MPPKLTFVHLKNFVNFKDHIFLDFKNLGGDVDGELNEIDGNVFAFVGSNGSGKSSLIEAIRRCCETSQSHSLSSSYDDKPSIVKCVFEKQTGDTADHSKGKRRRTDESTRPEKSEKLVSIYLTWVVDSRKQVCKLLVGTKDNKPFSSMIQTETSNDDVCQTIKWVNTHKCVKDEDCKNILKNSYDRSEKSLDDIYRIVTEQMQKGECEEFNDAFTNFVGVEVVFAFRGVGSSIYSSKQVKTTSPSMNYNMATRNASFIMDYLQATQNEPDKYDSVLEEKIFQTMVNEKFEFRQICKDGSGEQLLTVENVKSGKKFSILKIPGGILDAKYISITLARRETDIVFIEEPGKGMHPEMSNGMINFVFQDQDTLKNKQVFITTHNKNFLTPSILKNTFVCLKRKGGVCTIRPAISKKDNIRPHIEGYFLATIVFCHRIIFVEGDSDLRFVAFAKDRLIRSERVRSSYLKALKTENRDIELDELEAGLKRFLISLTVEQLHGCHNKKPVDSICKHLGVWYNLYYLFDTDTMETMGNTDNDHTFIWNLKQEPRHVTRTESAECSKSIGDMEIDSTKGIGTEETGPKETTGRPDSKLSQDTTDSGESEQQSRSGEKTGVLEDIIIQFSDRHDKNYHVNDVDCRVRGCKGLIKMLQSYKMIPIVEGPYKMSCKFLLDKNLKHPDVCTIVQRLLECACEYREGEVWRFLQFLGNSACREKM